MKDIFNDFTAWFWPLLGGFFTTIWDFIIDVFNSLSNNQSDIVSVVGYIAFAALILFTLKKLLDFMVGYFSGFTKDDIKGKAKKGSIYLIIILFLASFISFQMGAASCS